MEEFLIIIVVVLAIMAFSAHQDIKGLKKRIAALEGGEGVAAPKPRPAARAESFAIAPESEAGADATDDDVEGDIGWASNVAQGPWMRAQASAAAANDAAKRAPVNWEHMLGVRLPVWGGGGAIIVRGFPFCQLRHGAGDFYARRPGLGLRAWGRSVSGRGGSGALAGHRQ